MSLLQGSLQRKLSSLLGMQVTLEHVNLSPLKGSLDVRGISLAGGDGRPAILEMERVQASVSLLRAMKRRISVKSLTLARPVINLVQTSDGRLNLPERINLDADEEDDRIDEAARDELDEEATEQDASEDDAEGGWSLDVQKVLIVDGELRFSSDWGALSGYRVRAGRVLAELIRVDDGYDFTVMLESISRQDRPATLEPINVRGSLSGVKDLRRAAAAALSATIDLAGMLEIKAESASLEDRTIDVKARGSVNLPRLLAMLPSGIGAAGALEGARGMVSIDASANYAPERGLLVPTCSITSTEIGFPGLGRR